VEDAIEVLRTTSLSTYENRRISTGVLLFGKDLNNLDRVSTSESTSHPRSPLGPRLIAAHLFSYIWQKY